MTGGRPADRVSGPGFCTCLNKCDGPFGAAALPCLRPWASARTHLLEGFGTMVTGFAGRPGRSCRAEIRKAAAMHVCLFCIRAPSVCLPCVARSANLQ